MEKRKVSVESGGRGTGRAVRDRETCPDDRQERHAGESRRRSGRAAGGSERGDGILDSSPAAGLDDRDAAVGHRGRRDRRMLILQWATAPPTRSPAHHHRERGE